MSTLARAWDAVVQGLLALAGFALALVTLLIAWDVIARNLGLEPPASTVALTEYALLYTCMAAGPWLVRERGHVSIDLLTARLSPASQRAVGRLMLVLAAATALVIAALAAQLAVEAAARDELDVRSLDVPRQWLFLPLAVGFGLMAGEFLRLLVRGEAASRPAAEREAL